MTSFKIPKEYDFEEDFGFSAVSEEEVFESKNEVEKTTKDRFEAIEKLIMPLLVNLLKTSDQEYIKWPNRKPILEEKIESLLKLTRE